MHPQDTLAAPIPVAIALDGPAASGKTVVGKALAARLGCRFLDTGVMYRAVTWQALQAKVKLRDAKGLTRLAQASDLRLRFDDEGVVSEVCVRGEDVTSHLRDPEVDRAVSQVSLVAGVRDVLVAHQRRLAQEGCIVMAGRDIGTVVLEDAPVKLFITASVQERARRRYRELAERGLSAPVEEVQRDLEQRDKLDSERKVSPMRPARDAQVIVTDGMTVEQVVSFLMAVIERRLQ